MLMTPRSTMNGKPVIRVPVKTVLNLKSGFKEKLLSDGPALALGDACAYSCEFCYVPAIYQKLDRVRLALEAAGKRHDEVVILREGGLEILKGQLLHENGKRRFPDPEDRRVVYASPADDVAANVELAAQTVEACKLILTHTNWQIRLLSKSPLLTKIAGDLLTWEESNPKEASDLFGEPINVRGRVIFGFSTGTLSDQVARLIETGTPLVSKRINALHVLQDNGFRTFAMVCPSLPLPNQFQYRQFAAECAERLRYDRCEHVWAEVINLRGESFKRTINALQAGMYWEAADLLVSVCNDPGYWEMYNRETFLAHAEVSDKYLGKLRYLTYVSGENRAWWQKQICRGAVLL
jgi:DNA repair photolyase